MNEAASTPIELPSGRLCLCVEEPAALPPERLSEPGSHRPGLPERGCTVLVPGGRLLLVSEAKDGPGVQPVLLLPDGAGEQLTDWQPQGRLRSPLGQLRLGDGALLAAAPAAPAATLALAWDAAYAIETALFRSAGGGAGTALRLRRLAA